MAWGLERHGLKITFTHLNYINPEVVVGLGTEVRTLQLEEFIDYWLKMSELVPKAAHVHLASREKLARQGRERFRGTRHIYTFQ